MSSWIFFILLPQVQGMISPKLQISVNSQKLATIVDDRFLSLALGSTLIKHHWSGFDFKSQKLLTLARGLSPVYLRLGGTSADCVIFEEDCPQMSNVVPSFDEFDYDLDGGEPLTNFTMCGSDWIKINQFCQQVNWTFLFDFNVLPRKADNSWDPSNAREILNFSSAHGFGNLAWELGNEPNSLQRHFNFSLDPLQLGRDFYSLKILLKEYPLYRDSILVGPDVNHIYRNSFSSILFKVFPWLWNYFQTWQSYLYLYKVHLGSKGVLDAFTIHQYFLDGHKATLKDFLDPQVLSDFRQKIADLAKFMKKNRMDIKPLWLGETASAYGGGARGLSDRFVSSFLWLNKLGIAALNNYQVIIRQTFYGGGYAMIDDDLNPNPDYWTSWVYKRLISNRVINVDINGGRAKSFNIYAHCTAQQYASRGSVTLFGINMSSKNVTLTLPEYLSASQIHQFRISPKDGDLTSKAVLLNGVEMKLTTLEDLPELVPEVLGQISEIVNLPNQITFWVFPDANFHKIC